MAKFRLYRAPNQQAWSASGSISQELSPVPFTATGMILVLHTSVTTTLGTWYNDPWDRIIANLSLTGQVAGQNKSFFSFSNLQLPYHLMRRELGRFCPRRPTKIVDSATTQLQQFAYLFHFGAQPFKANGEFNHMDLSAGIPPTQKGQLTLGGAFAAAAAMGSANVTLVDGDIDIYLYGVQSESGDKPEDYMPRAWPVWSMTSPTPTATSTMFGTPYSITSGNFLRNIAIMATNGSGNPRDSQVFNSLRLYSQLENRDILSFGDRAGASDAAGGDYKIAELWSQLGIVVPSDDIDNRSGGTSAPGVISNAGNVDAGLVFLPLYALSNKVNPLYGADLRRIASGDLRIDWGVNDATGIRVDVLYQRYELNPEHPANAGLA